MDLPTLVEWSRWEGTDRAGRSMEIDLLAELTDGRMFSGAVKWNRRPVTIDIYWQHLDMLRRGAHAGRKWAHQALEPDALIVYVAAGGFSDDFEKAVSDAEQQTPGNSIRMARQPLSISDPVLILV